MKEKMNACCVLIIINSVHSTSFLPFQLQLGAPLY